jgi:hypothetical protein
MRRRTEKVWTAWALVPVVLACAACSSREAGARAQFARDVICPEYRVAVSPGLLVMDEREPPADIAADPERLQMWQEREAERRAAEERKQYFIAQGCGEQRVYHCFYCVRTPGKTRCGAYPSCTEQPSCAEAPDSPGHVACDGSR